MDRAALRFLIESLNDDGYLDESLEALAVALAGEEDPEQVEELVHRFTVALRLLQSLEPVGVGARGLSECLALQLRALQEDGDAEPEVLQAALRICNQPLEMLARRDVRRLAQGCGAGEECTRAAMALIARLEPRPGRAFAQVERNIIVPDVIVKKSSGRGAAHAFTVQLNPDVMPRLRVHDIYAGGCAATAAARGTRRCSSGCRKRVGSSRTSSSGSTPSCASRAPSWTGRRTSSCMASWPCGRSCCATSPTNWGCTNRRSAG